MTNATKQFTKNFKITRDKPRQDWPCSKEKPTSLTKPCKQYQQRL